MSLTTEQALLNLVKAVDNHTKSYGDSNWRNQACAQLERAEMDAMETLGLDYFADEFADENNHDSKVGS